MRSIRAIEVVGCHAEGEVGDVIVGGVAPPPGDTVWEQSRFIARDGKLRAFVLNEPRGGVFRHVNLLVPPTTPAAQMGFIIMEPEDTPPMSGSNCICVATVLLDTGIIAMQEPETRMVLEAPAGLVEIRAQCRNGKAERITLRNVPAFADRLQVPLDVEGLGTVMVDTAFGGDSFVMAEAKRAGLRHDAGRGWRYRQGGATAGGGGQCATGFFAPAAAGVEALFLCVHHRASRNCGWLPLQPQCLRDQSRQD